MWLVEAEFALCAPFLLQFGSHLTQAQVGRRKYLQISVKAYIDQRCAMAVPASQRQSIR
jgi:hypothetical protein